MYDDMFKCRFFVHTVVYIQIQQLLQNPNECLFQQSLWTMLLKSTAKIVFCSNWLIQVRRHTMSPEGDPIDNDNIKYCSTQSTLYKEGMHF